MKIRLFIVFAILLLVTSCASNAPLTKDELIESAKSGDVENQYILAEYYLTGSNKAIKQDLKKSLYWTQKAVAQGYPRAQGQLGVMYKNGWGVEKDTGKAASWYRKAFDNGDYYSAVNMGLLLADEKKYKSSKEWLSKIFQIDDYKYIRVRKHAAWGLSRVEYALGNKTEAYVWFGVNILVNPITDTKISDGVYMDEMKSLEESLSNAEIEYAINEIVRRQYALFVKHESYVRNKKLPVYKDIVMLGDAERISFMGYQGYLYADILKNKTHFSKKEDEISQLNYALYSLRLADKYLRYANVDLNYVLAYGSVDAAREVFSKHYDENRLGKLKEVVERKHFILEKIKDIQRNRVSEFKRINKL